MKLLRKFGRRKFLSTLALSAGGIFVPGLFIPEEREAEGQPLTLNDPALGMAKAKCNLGTNSATTPWLARLSDTPSQQTKDATNCLMNTLDAAGVTSSILAMNTIDTTSLSNALKPILQGGHAADWTNHNFASGDLTANGLQGDGTTKYCQTNNFGNDYASNANAGLSIYVSALGSGANNRDCGYGNDAGTDSINLYSKFAGNSLAQLWQNATNISGTPMAGFYSLNRTATNLVTLYFGNSTTPFASVGTDTSEGTALGAHELYICGWNHWSSGTPTDAGLSGSRISFYVQHNGLTIANATSLFNAVQTFLTNRGGGSV